MRLHLNGSAREVTLDLRGLSGSGRTPTSGTRRSRWATDLRILQIGGITVARLARTARTTMPLVNVTPYPDLARRLAGTDSMPQIFIRPLGYPALAGGLRTHPRSA